MPAAFHPEPLAPCLARLATSALIEEASLPGKPGLVGPDSPGAHGDMDLELMIASARVLEPWFEEAARLSLAFSGSDGRALLAALRGPGQGAEAAMLEATRGVNTHKGALFSLGLLIAAFVLHSRSAPAPSPGLGTESHGLGLAEGVLATAAGMAQGLGLELDIPGQARALSAGQRLHRELGVAGARGQAEAGYPVLASRVLPPLRRARGLGPRAREEALLEALLGAMGELEDTCLLSRGGLEGLEFARAGAREVLGLWTGAGGLGDGSAARAGLAKLGRDLAARRLSPGGSADLLAGGIFLDSLESGD